MNKKVSLLLLCFALFAVILRSQPPPPSGSVANNPNEDVKKPPAAPSTANQTQVQALTSGKPPKSWYCSIHFYYNGCPYYTEDLVYGDATKYRGFVSKKVDNKINEVYWDGNRCFCWIVVYQDTYFNGLNLGLWTDSTSGSYDLNQYTTWNWNQGGWQPWATTVSSYAVYCY